jgi:serine/threonine-protein kinase
VTTRLAGTALIISGAALSVVSYRLAIRDRAAAEAAAAVVAKAPADSEGYDAEELRTIERKARQAAEIEPLAAAVKMNVDANTLMDLFDTEEWWRPYRKDFDFERLIVDGGILGTRGSAEVGMLDKPIVKQARRLGAASGSITIGNKPFLIAAARLPILPDSAPMIVLGRTPRLAPVPTSVAAAPPPPAPPIRPLPFVLTGVMVLAGIGVLVFGRRAPSNALVIADVAVPPRTNSSQQPMAQFWAPGAPGWQDDTGRVPVVPQTGSGTAPIPILTEGGATAPVVDSTGPVSMLGRYRLLDRLGEGGMAELFVAEVSGVEGFSRTFVLKRLRPELATEKDAVAQFVEEARLQASLVHSNIVPVFDFGMAGSQYFMTQEYIIGRDLARLMLRQHERGGRGVSPEIAFFIAHEVLQALAYAHDTRDRTGAPMGIVHRDVAAGNVMVSFQGEVKLSDFGIVKSNRRVSKTQVGMVKGNANFMSPEQARGNAVDGRSDLFSLGLLLHYCLTGELLYWGENDLETLYRAANGPTGEDVAAICALPEPAASILTRALALDPNDRFQTAAEFGEALAPHIGAGKHAIARLMQRLFADEIHRRQTA